MDGDELKRRFGQRVQMLRRQRDMTQEQLAEAIGKSTDTVSNIETGRLSTRIETAMHLAEVLQVSLSELFEIGHIRSPNDYQKRLAVEDLLSVVNDMPAENVKKVTKIIRIAMEL